MKLNQETDVKRGAIRTDDQLILDTCREVLGRVDAVKRAILAEFRPTLIAREQLLRLAVNEAEALAWQTDYPHLLFPVLAVEKAQAVAAWDAQQGFMQRQQPSLRLAA